MRASTERTTARLAGLEKAERSTISPQGFLCAVEAEGQVLGSKIEVLLMTLEEPPPLRGEFPEL